MWSVAQINEAEVLPEYLVKFTSINFLWEGGLMQDFSTSAQLLQI